MHKYMTIRFSNGELWAVPVEIIAGNRADYFASEDNISFSEALAETNRLFEHSPEEIIEWASSQMNWHDFDGHQIKVEEKSIDFQEEYNNGKKGFLDDETM